MFKPNSTCAVLGILALCCLPVVAATISSDEMQLRLNGGRELSLNHYQFSADSVALMGIKTSPGDLVWCFAVAEDAWGEADYSNILTLHFGRTEDGLILAFFEIPAALEGMTFHVQAVAEDSKGDMKSSPEVIVAVGRRPEGFGEPHKNDPTQQK